MTTFAEELQQAKVHHSAGRLLEAEQLYRRLVEHEPSHFEVHHLLGAALQAQGRLDEAAASLAEALRCKPDFAEAHYHLAVVSLQAGRVAQALECLSRAVQCKPDFAEAHGALGTLLARQGNAEAAIASFQRQVELQPENTAARNELGVLLARAGRFDEAESPFRFIVEREPNNARALLNLGGVLSKLDRFAEAVEMGRRAVAIAPESPDANINLAIALEQLGQLEEAEAVCRRALAQRPSDVLAQNTLASVVERQGKSADAEKLIAECLASKPSDPELRVNYGAFLVRQNRLSEAETEYRRAIQLAPGLADAHVRLAMTLLLAGKWTEGWAEHEWRWTALQLRQFLKPSWTGEDLAGRTILLHGEQGLGDTLQFVRYAKLVRQKAGTVIVECQPQLARLVATCAGVDHVLARGGPLPRFDAFIPLLSLPGIFGTLPASVPAEVPYVFPDEQLVASWRSELAAENRFKIGIAWRGSPGNVQDRLRSFPLGEFALLAALPGVQLYSLQFGRGREELAAVAGRWPIVDLGDRLGDFYTTAAIVRNMDLVITCDSAPLHLAGALGVPTWVALGSSPDWRWMLARDDSPWYPSVRLFRQTTAGDWVSAFARMQEALEELLG